MTTAFSVQLAELYLDGAAPLVLFQLVVYISTINLVIDYISATDNLYKSISKETCGPIALREDTKNIYILEIKIYYKTKLLLL